MNVDGNAVGFVIVSVIGLGATIIGNETGNLSTLTAGLIGYSSAMVLLLRNDMYKKIDEINKKIDELSKRNDKSK